MKEGLGVLYWSESGEKKVEQGKDFPLKGLSDVFMGKHEKASV